MIDLEFEAIILQNGSMDAAKGQQHSYIYLIFLKKFVNLW